MPRSMARETPASRSARVAAEGERETGRIVAVDAPQAHALRNSASVNSACMWRRSGEKRSATLGILAKGALRSLPHMYFLFEVIEL